MEFDLSENRLGGATTADFAAMLRALASRGMVRFGYEIFCPCLKAAMEETETSSWLGHRMEVQSPWAEFSVRCIIRQMQLERDALVKTLETTTGTRLGDLDTEVARALARYMTDSEIIVTSYDWRHRVEGIRGELDALVLGKLPGEEEPVLVMAEAKSNMTKDIKDAKKQLASHAVRWKELCSGDELDEKEQEDYANLRVESLCKYPLVFALGGLAMPDSLKRERDPDGLSGKRMLRIDIHSGVVSEE